MIGIITKIAGWLIPSLTSTQTQVSSIDSLISKRGQTTKIEIIIAFSEKILLRLFYIYLAWAFITDRINIVSLITLVKSL